MLEDQLKKELPEIFLSSIQNIIHGNHVDGKELVLENSAVYPFKLTVTVNWQFTSEWENQRIAGGKSASVHSGMDSDHFDEIHENNIYDAANNKIRRLDFINDYKNAGTNGLIDNHKKVIHNYPTHSYHYDCGSCNGKGEGNCILCAGTGRKSCDKCWGSGQVQEYYTEYNNWKNTYEQRSRHVSCGRCYGRGRLTCYNCSGSGRQKCSSCSGHGYFTYYRTTSLVAVPSNQFNINCQEHAQKLVDYLAECKLTHLYQHIYFSGFNYDSIGQSYERFTYYGDSFLTEIFTNLRSTQHHIVGYSNPPLPFIRSGIFDQLFIEEISMLEEYQETSKIIPKEKALKFFNKFSGQPVLERSLRGVAKDRTSADQDHTAMIQEQCSYFITQKSAKQLANGINAILDKVSPAYNGLVWTIAALIFFIPVCIYCEYIFETANVESIWEAFWTAIGFVFFVFLLYIIYSIITLLISVIICSYNRRNVPQEFRQKFRNSEPFFSTAFIGSFFIIVVGMYGYAANNIQWLPKAGSSLVDLSIKSINYVKPTSLIHWYCQDDDPFENYRKDNFVCRSKYFIDVNKIPEEKFIHINTQMKIQEILHEHNQDILIDGKIGLKTKKAIVEYFDRNNMKYDENWSYDQILMRMIINEKNIKS